MASGSLRSTSASTDRNAGRLPCTSETSAIFLRGTITVRGMRGHRSGLPLAMAVAVVAAGAATLILRPRSGLIEPAAVDAAAYFSSAQLDRAGDFRDVQRLIGLGGLAVSGGTLALLALRPPRQVAELLERAGRRPVAGGAVVGAGLSLALVATGLPLSLWAHERAVDVGLSTQSLGPLARRRGPLCGHRRRRWRDRRGGGDRAPAPVPAPLVDPGGRRGHRLRGAGDLRLAGARRPALQRLRAAAARRASLRGARARRRGRGWTWGRSTAWTRAVAPPPSTPTWAASGTPSGSCSTTT